MPTESFPIAPTVLSVPLHSYGMLAYQLEISDLRSRREIAICSENCALSEDGDLLRSLSNQFRILKLRFEIAELRSQIPKLRYVV
jgi:hypothetical protein